MEALRSPCAAKWLSAAGGRTSPGGARGGEGAARCRPSWVLPLRAQHGGFSPLFLWRRPTALVPWRRATELSPTAAVLTENGAETEVTPVQTETVEVEPETPSEVPKTAHVRFTLQKSCEFGEQFLVVGGDPMLGLWNPANAIPLEWSDGHVWAAEVDLPVGEDIEFKFILHALSGKIKWQPGPNRVLQTEEATDTVVVAGDWESPVDEKVSAEGDGGGTDESQAEISQEEKPIVENEDPVLIPGLASVPVSSTEAEAAASSEVADDAASSVVP